MRAAALTGFNEPLAVVETPAPKVVDPTDVIVRVTGAGLCGSDLHLIEGALVDAIGTPAFPYVIGHENAGFVEEVGPDVRTVGVGDPVLLHPLVSCGLCRACRREEERFCTNGFFPGVDGRNGGGFAELMRTTERAVLKLPVGTDPGALAPIADAGLSAYHAVRRLLGRLPPDGTVVVVGIGGLGYFAIQLLRAFSPATIVAVDRIEARLAYAVELGADHALLSCESTVSEVTDLTAGLGVDIVLDCAAAGHTADDALAVLRRGGVYSVLGAGDAQICCGATAMTGRELTIEGNLVGSFAELMELTHLTLDGKVHLVQRSYPLEHVEQAIHDLRTGAVDGRAVILPQQR